MERPLRVLQVFASLGMGGAESRMMDVYRRIDKSKVQFDFVTLQSGEQFFSREILNMGGVIYNLKSPREIGTKKHIDDLRKCLREGAYDAVHAHTSYHCGMVMLAARLERIPVRISHARTTGSQSKSRSKAISIWLGRRLINKYATKKLAISKAAGEYVFGNKRFEVLPNAIDVEKYQISNETEVCLLKNKLGIEDSDFVIGQIGRFDPMKNHMFTISWFSEFLKTNPESKMVLVGDGSLKERVISFAKECGIYDRIVFTGIRNDVYKLIHVFDVLLFPSVFEGLGGVALEAQAAGIPVVESNSVPLENDMGLGLVQRVSLQDEKRIWTEAVLKSKDILCPSYEIINQKFSDRNYTLKSSVERLTEIYRGLK